jgi:glycosyltransferase involved in cell wall biosynthesis
MTSPRVSVIIPAYNAAAFLDQSIPSASKQTHSNLEIIIIDDASTDNTLEIANRHAATDPRIRVLRHEKNSGLAATRNTGIRESKGEWIAFLDADDLFLPNKIELQLNLAAQDPRANLLYTNYWVWDGQRDLELRYRKRSKMPEGDVSKRLIFENQFCPSTVMARRQIIDEAGGFNPDLRAIEDWDLWLRIAEKGLWTRGVWEPQLRYRVWTGNMSKDSEKMTRYMIATFESALTRSHPPGRRRDYLKALNHARANREFALGRQFAGSDERALREVILRAWRLRPARVKWLLWWLGVAWPRPLGGKIFADMVHRRILAKW